MSDTMDNLAIPILITSLACLICALTDLRRFRVPNAVTLPLLASGLLYHASTGGWSGVRLGLVGAGFGFAILVVPYLLGGMGAGDVKLLAGIGAWLGRPMTYDVLVAAVLFAGFYALFLVLTTGRLRWTLATIRAIVARGPSRAEIPVRQAVTCADQHVRLVPFAAMMALGLLTTIIRG